MTGTTTTTPSSLEPAARTERYAAALAGRHGPLALVDLDAMWHNSRVLLARAAGKPVRVASKSVRCRHLLRTVLDSDPGYQGLLTFTLPETLWLAEQGFDDLLLAYPSTDRDALQRLAGLTAEDPDGAPVVMVDSVDHLDLIASAVPAGSPPVRVCLDLDASWWLARGRIRIGAKRTPVHSVEDARALAHEIVARPSLRLVGMMSYEGHIAGSGDRVPGQLVRSLAISRVQHASYHELVERRAAAVAAVREVADLELVNAGGTGDLELVAAEPAVTEATAGSGFFAPTLFDTYSRFELEPAALFAMPVSRRPGPGVVTVLGGGYTASGAPGRDRLPSPYLPAGLTLDSMEGAGEVQTPLRGDVADSLELGDPVFFRHAKAGELCERFDTLLLVEGERVVDEVPTYRGEGQCFL